MEERVKWDRNHEQHSYSDVFSILDSENVRSHYRRVLSGFLSSGEAFVKVLIPGCGSNVALQEICCEFFGDSVAITAVDWSESALQQARGKLAHRPNIEYLCRDFKDIGGGDGAFDIVLMSNSVVSPVFSENVAAIREFSRVTKAGGTLAGVLPCAFGMFDYALTSGLADHWLSDGTVDVRSKTVYEKSQDMRQRFFSPLELHVVCADNNLMISNLDVLFFSGSEFSRQMVRLYGVPYSDRYCLWGMFLQAKKVKK